MSEKSAHASPQSGQGGRERTAAKEEEEGKRKRKPWESACDLKSIKVRAVPTHPASCSQRRPQDR